MKIDQFVLDNLFHKIENNNETVYYRSVVEEGNGWIVIWPDGSHLHTYHYPPEWIGKE